jgi:two-component system phosphate regulon sensor histidine kinase PhoR
VSNAVRYTPVDGRIQVRWRVLPDGRAEFSVRDTGPGIAPEHLPRLFERFYRADGARSRGTGGAGLGLAICEWIARAHHGHLSVESDVGHGTTFTLWLPRATDGRAASKTPVTTQPAPVRGPDTSESPAVVVGASEPA